MMKVRCFLLSSELVDFATGDLDDLRRPVVERHVAGCPHCAETVLALREVPAELERHGRPEPGEEFWVRQRAQIMQVIEAGPPIAVRGATSFPRPSRAWRAAPALAAVAAVALFLVVNWLPSTGEKPQSKTVVASIEPRTAADDSVATLVEEPWPTVPDEVSSVDDATLAESMAEELGGVNEASLI